MKEMKAMCNNKVPKFKQRVIFICEGQEDKGYIDKLISLNVWNSEIYDFKAVNAKSASRIVSKYDSIVSNESSSSVVLIFCDTDKTPHKEYLNLKKKLQNIYGGDSAFNRIVIFANPCTMRIVLAHFSEKAKLKTQSKSQNARLIEKLTNVNNYKAAKKQIRSICQKITKENYYQMKKELLNESNKSYDITGSTNFIKFLEHFESDDPSWINEINKGLNY